jgi:secreted trypsin-like serine protease
LFASRNDISGRNLNISEAKLIGIVSSGKTCGDVQFPTMYTRISAVSDWINETTGI